MKKSLHLLAPGETEVIMCSFGRLVLIVSLTILSGIIIAFIQG